jgi:hypothetical protein
MSGSGCLLQPMAIELGAYFIAASQPDICAKAVPDISKNWKRLAQAPRSAMKRTLT